MTMRYFVFSEKSKTWCRVAYRWWFKFKRDGTHTAFDQKDDEDFSPPAWLEEQEAISNMQEC